MKTQPTLHTPADRATGPAAPARAGLTRLWRLTRAELGFAARYGIAPLYGLITVIYLVLLSVMAESARAAAGGVIILTDPAAMGLFFMGAMVMLEKSQRVNCALAVSPVRAEEYIAAKSLALMGLGLLVGLIVGGYAGINAAGVLLSVALGSFMFSMLGIIVACASVSLNQFLILSIPVEIITFVPALFYWFGALRSPLWLAHPAVAAIALLGPGRGLWPWAAASLLVWDAVVFLWCRRTVQRYFEALGGGKL